MVDAEKIKTVKYNCGHEGETKVIAGSPISTSIYLTWMETYGFQGDKSMCFDCY